MNLLRSLLFLAFASFAQAQFAPILTNATLAGSGTKVPSGGTLTIQSGGTLDFSAGTVVGTIPIAGGGTGAITAAAARTNLGLGTLSTLSTISLTTNVSGILPGANGGTGVANTGKTITLGGNLTLSGAFDATFTLTAGTGVTFPVSGTLATLAGSESLTNKKLGSLTSNGVVHTSAGDGTLSVATVSVAEGGTGITSGTSGGIPYFSGATSIASSGVLTANYVMLGGGSGATPRVVASPGTTATVLHGNATGIPAFSAVDVTTDITGVVPVANGGTNVASYTKGDILIASASTTLTKLAVGTDNQVLTANSAASTGVSWATGGGGGGSGNVTGPASSTNTNIVTWNGTAGTSVSNGSGLTAVSGTITAATGTMNLAATAGNVTLTAASGLYTIIAGNSTGGPYMKLSRVGGYDYHFGVDTGSTPAFVIYDNDAVTKLFTKKSTGDGSINVTTGKLIINGATSGPVVALTRAAGGYFFHLGITSGNAFTLYDNDGTTDLFGVDSNDAHFNLGTGKLWVKGATGGGPFLRISRGTAYNYFLGVDGSSNFKFYDNDGSTELFGVTQSTGNFKVVNSLTFSTSGKGIAGTATNDSASAGVVGEYVSSLIAVGSAVSLTTATAANVTSISLTAGDWDVAGVVNFSETTATVSARTAGISTTSATLPTDGSEGYCGVQSTVTSETNSIALTRKRITISGTTTVYLVGQATFSAGTAAGFGTINARRVR
jgi:hypothetical protein